MGDFIVGGEDVDKRRARRDARVAQAAGLSTQAVQVRDCFYYSTCVWFFCTCVGVYVCVGGGVGGGERGGGGVCVGGGSDEGGTCFVGCCWSWRCRYREHVAILSQQAGWPHPSLLTSPAESTLTATSSTQHAPSTVPSTHTASLLTYLGACPCYVCICCL